MAFKRYTPSLERVWAEWARHQRVLKLRARRRAKGLPERDTRIPDNSVPWLPHKPRNFAELDWISREVRRHTQTWLKRFPPSSKA